MYKKVLYYNKINVAEGIDINKPNKSKECVVSNYWYYLHLNYTNKPEVCNECHDISKMAFDLENIAVLYIKGFWF